MKNNILYKTIAIAFLFCCDINSIDRDCNGDEGGDAYIDSCGICSNGNTGYIPDSDKDCKGECFGKAQIDECGICDGNGIELNACDCMGSLNDCAGVCGGDAKLDVCGICNGTSIDQSYCECLDGSIKDCNGLCESDGDDYGAELNACGVCGGGDLDHNQDCGGNCISNSFRDSCNGCISTNAGLRLRIKSNIVVSESIEEQDNYNFIGLSYDAFDDFDIEYDVPEPQGDFKLYFPHNDWEQSDVDFTEDIKFFDSSKLFGDGIVWDAVISTQHDAPLPIDLFIEVMVAESCSWCSKSYNLQSIIVAIDNQELEFIDGVATYTEYGTSNFIGDGEASYQITIRDACYDIID